MIISVINHSNGLIKDEELEFTIRAINRQIAEDFEPYWSFGAKLRLEGRSETRPSKETLADMRGDAVIYVWNKPKAGSPLSYHDKNNRGIPYGFVFKELSDELDEEWTVTLSHEALELTADPESNLFVRGPHPTKRNRTVFHWYEMCDAVQAETYKIDNIDVSNFVLPLYFTSSAEKGGRNDFLSRKYDAFGKPAPDGKTLKSFGINPGGYLGFYDPKNEDEKSEMHTMDGDTKARKRLMCKLQTKTARITRHEFLTASRDRLADKSPIKRNRRNHYPNILELPQ
jgi:hypothetical protein